MRRTTTLTATRLVIVGLTNVLAFCTLHLTALGQERPSPDHWVGTWATAAVTRPQPAVTPPAADPSSAQGRSLPAFGNHTLRQIVHTSIGGDRVRVVLSNVFGTAPLTIGAAHIALRDKEALIALQTDRALRFSGQGTITIPPGAVMVSDPVNLTVAALAELVVDLYIPEQFAPQSSPLTAHNGARQTSYVSTPGDHTGEASLPVATTIPSWFFLARVEVSTPSTSVAVVTFGDSITDGYNSTPDTNNRWPDHLAKRLSQSGTTRTGVLNAGIDGNKVLADGLGVSALARFDRDVLAQTGAKYLVVLEGINDLGIVRDGRRPTAVELIAGYEQLIARAHAHDLKIYGGTLMPFQDAAFPGYWTAEGEGTRQAVNQWIRGGSSFDAVLDFDAVVRDPVEPNRYRAQYDSGDHLHPNDAGYQAVAAAVDLGLFGGSVMPSGIRQGEDGHAWSGVGGWNRQILLALHAERDGKPDAGNRHR
jgi:lysophospholipase L1-like esterase